MLLHVDSTPHPLTDRMMCLLLIILVFVCVHMCCANDVRAVHEPFLCAYVCTTMLPHSTHECRYTGARFQPSCEGELSPLGEVVRLGADASGLLVSHTQYR